MERIKILPLTILFAVFILLTGTPKTECQLRAPPLPARPLCLSQFALANHACSLLPFTTASEPSPPSDELLHVNSDGDEDGDGDHGSSDHEGRHSRRGHGHRRRHRHRHHETPIEEDCCRWLKAVDDLCVCEVLVHLPVFLARPMHHYNVVVDESCNITYSCGGRVLRA